MRYFVKKVEFFFLKSSRCVPAALRSQHELQQQSASDLERQLGKSDATLARLCSQQAVMKARLQAAVAQQRLEGGLPQPKVRRWLLPAAIGGAGLLAVALLLLIISRPNIPPDSSQPVPTVTPSAVSPSVAAKPVPAVTAPFSLCGTGLDSGGALLPAGTVDPNYTIVKAPSGFSPPLTPKVIHNVPTRRIVWVRNTPISQWINPTGDGSQDLDAGSYIYQTTFDLSDFDPDTASIHGNWAADGAAKIYLNGRSTGISLPKRHSSITVLHPFSITSGFRAGTNTLDFHVTNGGTSRNPTGIHVQIARTTAAVVADRANVARHTSGATAEPEPAEQPPKPNSKVPPGAALLMTFDKNTLLEVSGFIFRIRSLTGRYNGKDVSSQYTPDGKVGGALSIEDGSEVRIPGHIINRQPEYTVAAWVKRKEKEHLWVYNENADGTIFNFEAQTNGAVAVRTWHKDRGPSPSYPGGNWMAVGTPDALVSANQWVFVAARLVNGQVNRGQLTIRVNDRSYARELQMTYHGRTQHSSIGSGNGACEDRTCGRGAGLVDELAIYPRALSDAEIETLYQMGLRGESLGI